MPKVAIFCTFQFISIYSSVNFNLSLVHILNPEQQFSVLSQKYATIKSANTQSFSRYPSTKRDILFVAVANNWVTVGKVHFLVFFRAPFICKY